MLSFLCLLALADSPDEATSASDLPGRAQLAPDPRRNVRDSAHVLEHGEVMLGTDGFAVGVLPSVQVETQLLLDAVGWFNGGAKLQAIRSRHVGLSVQGGGGAATWGDMSGRNLQVGSTMSLTPFRALSLHGGTRYAVFSAEGIPTSPPPAVAEWLPMQQVLDAGAASADAGLIPRVYSRSTEVRAAVELRFNRRDSVVVQGATTVWGQNGTDLLTNLPGQGPLDPAAASVVDWLQQTGTTGTRRISVSYRVAFGNADVRLGGGVSDQPGAWLLDANGFNLRAFGEARREDQRLLAEAREVAEEGADDHRVASVDGEDATVALP